MYMLITRIYTHTDVTFDRYLLKYMGDNMATAGALPHHLAYWF